MVTETELHYRQPCYDSVRMAQQQRQYSPTPETVSSAADAMLKLSGGSHHGGGGGGEYLYHSPKQGDRGASMYHTAQVEYHSTNPASMSSSPCSPTSAMVSTTVPTSPRSRSSSLSRLQRKEREFVPDFRKDSQYWLKRQKNNEAAKRSREKRRMNDMVMSDRLSQVAEEKHKLQMELDAIKRHFGLPIDKTFHAGDASHSVSPASSPGKTPGSDTTRSSPLYDNHSGSPPIKPAPPLIPLQGRLAEVIAQRMMSKPPPLEPVPDSPPVGSVSPVYPQHRQMYNNASNNSQVLHSHHQQHHQHQQHQHYATSQQYQMSAPLKQQQQQPESPQSAASSDHPTQFQYNMYSQQSPRSPSYPSVHSPCSPQNLQIVLSPQPSDHGSQVQSQGDNTGSGHSYADHNSNRDEHSTTQTHDDLGAPLNLCKRRRIDVQDQDEEQTLPVRAEQRKGIPHKLRYKNYSSEIREAEQDSNDGDSGTGVQWHIPENSTANPQLSMANVYQHAMRQNSDDQGSYREVREARYSTSSSTHLESSMDVSDNSQPSGEENENSSMHQETSKPDDATDEADPRYLERRERNNMAARKCRENRRLTNELRLVKSHVLENENVKLKDELRNLSEEVHGLKKLIEKKHQAQEAGELFEPPEDLLTKVEPNDH